MDPTEIYLMVWCEGCGETEPVPGMSGVFRPTRDADRTARVIPSGNGLAVKCDKCGWHEPLEFEDVPPLLMQITETDSVLDLFVWVAMRIGESNGAVP